MVFFVVVLDRSWGRCFLSGACFGMCELYEEGEGRGRACLQSALISVREEPGTERYSRKEVSENHKSKHSTKKPLTLSQTDPLRGYQHSGKCQNLQAV